MKKKIVFALSALAVLVIVATGCNSASDPGRAIGEAVGISVPITSNPPGAEIKIDGAFVGMTNGEYRLSPGEHQIEISLTGYEPWSRKINVIRGTQVRVTLEPR